MKKLILTSITALAMCSMVQAQLFRPTDQTGINVFETPKDTNYVFKGLKTTIGGSFTQQFQSLSDYNTPTPAGGVVTSTAAAATQLNPITSGFDLAEAKLDLNTELSDGIALKMELYLASRHHNETWVKGGYIQINKVNFIHIPLLDQVMKYTTVKIGQTDVNYGDAHFRRSDGAATMYNPFIENYIMDEFATEIGVEADVNYHGLIFAGSVTDGLLNGTVNETLYPNDGAGSGKLKPSLLAKIGVDRTLLDNKLRVRLTGSTYFNPTSGSNTLMGGDRTGSNYVGVMDAAAPSTATAFDGRYNPGFTDRIEAYMGNLFLKYKINDYLNVESFTTIEKASGRGKAEWTGSRNANQIAEDVVVRFGKHDEFFIGGRVNKLSTTVAPNLNAMVFSAATNQYEPAGYTYGADNRYDVSIFREAECRLVYD